MSVSSVVDPFVFEPPGSGSVPKCHGSTTMLVRELGVALEAKERQTHSHSTKKHFS